MSISSSQCRAARGLLNWNQDELATNARIARATVADFENNLRRPMKNNLLAIEDCVYAAGVEFLDETDAYGCGVRFREQKLQYINNVRIVSGDAAMQMIYDGVEFKCVVPAEVLDDRAHGSVKTDDEVRTVMSDNLHHILSAAERALKAGFRGDRLVLSHNRFPPELFR